MRRSRVSVILLGTYSRIMESCWGGGELLSWRTIRDEMISMRGKRMGDAGRREHGRA